jgi:hypothetical protein
MVKMPPPPSFYEWVRAIHKAWEKEPTYKDLTWKCGCTEFSGRRGIGVVQEVKKRSSSPIESGKTIGPIYGAPVWAFSKMYGAPQRPIFYPQIIAKTYWLSWHLRCPYHLTSIEVANRTVSSAPFWALLDDTGEPVLFTDKEAEYKEAKRLQKEMAGYKEGSNIEKPLAVADALIAFRKLTGYIPCEGGMRRERV